VKNERIEVLFGVEDARYIIRIPNTDAEISWVSGSVGGWPVFSPSDISGLRRPVFKNAKFGTGGV